MGSAPTPFLTDLDSRAAVKGSVDPLGVQVIWVRLGRHVVGNLTTVSNSVRDFVTTILGYHFAESLAARDIVESDLATFIKWEQLAAYARGHVNNDWEFRGTERAKNNIDGGEVRISADLSAQLLASQKTYGLWGLYSVPSRTSGLLEGEPTRLTEPARRLVERVYLPIIESKIRVSEVEQFLARSSRLDLKKDRDIKLLGALAAIWKDRKNTMERDLLREHLLYGGPNDETNGAQRALADAMAGTLDDAAWMMSSRRLLALAKEAATKGKPGEEASYRLRRIIDTERVLAPANVLFNQLLASNGETVDEVASRVSKQWRRDLDTIDVEAFMELRAELTDSTEERESAARWIALAQCLHDGEYKEACNLLLQQNARVMNARSGAAWVIEEDKKLQVRYLDLQVGPFPDRKALEDYWRNPYFIESLRFVARALREPK